MVQVSCKYWQAQQQPDLVVQATERIWALLEQESAELMHPPKMDAQRANARFTVCPSAKLKKQR